MSDRRRFLAKGGGALAAIAAAGGANAPNVIAQPKIQWRMSMASIAALDVNLHSAQRLAKAVEEMSGGRFLTDFHVKNAIALERLRTEFKGKVEVLQYPVPMLRELKQFAAEVVRNESEKSPMARKVHASFTQFQALVGAWDRVAEGAYHQFVAPKGDDR